MIDVNIDNFYEEVIQTKSTVFVDFWAPWCGPCKAVTPVIEELDGEYNDILFAKCNVDENPEISSEYGIRSIPSFLIFKNGDMVESITGASGKARFKKLINKYT
jgi:thioredoxin 1